MLYTKRLLKPNLCYFGKAIISNNVCLKENLFPICIAEPFTWYFSVSFFSVASNEGMPNMGEKSSTRWRCITKENATFPDIFSQQQTRNKITFLWITRTGVFLIFKAPAGSIPDLWEYLIHRFGKSLLNNILGRVRKQVRLVWQATAYSMMPQYIEWCKLGRILIMIRRHFGSMYDRGESAEVTETTNGCRWGSRKESKSK